MIRIFSRKRVGVVSLFGRASLLLLLGLGVSGAWAQQQSQGVTAKGGVFFDDFNRNDLGDNYEIIDADPNRLTIGGGKLVIVGTDPRKNTVLLKKYFQGDFVATVAVSMEIGEDNCVALTYYLDSKNYMALGICGAREDRKLPWDEGEPSMGAPGKRAPMRELLRPMFGTGLVTSDFPSDRRQPFFGKVVGGASSDIVNPIAELGDRKLEGYSSNVETWYFQLRREGSRYTGLMSADGVRWTRIGSHVIVQPGGQIGFMVGSGGGVENAAEFDDFSVQQ